MNLTEHAHKVWYATDAKERIVIGFIVYAIGGFIETIIGLRIILRLIGANASNAFVSWIYSWSTPFVAPFSGILGQDATVINGVGAATTSVFDWAALIALVVIGIIVGLIGSIFGRRRPVV